MKPIYFPGLNGLRAIAAIGVLFVHITQGLSLFGLDATIFGSTPSDAIAIHRIALYAVSIFFGISGFLITYLLLEEKQNGSINIKNFYIRRVLRIWPLYYAYLILTLITNFIFDVTYDKTQLFFYIFLLANIPFVLGKAIPFVTHYWSLGVEEQYYLFWPNFVKRIKHLFLGSLILFLVFMLAKLIFYLLANNPFYEKLYYVLDANRFQCMLIGALFAIVYHQKNKYFLRFVTVLPSQLLAWFVFILVFTNQFRISYFLSHEIITTATCIIIVGQIEQKNRIINLENKIFDFLGKISYGIYVIHPLIAIYLSKILYFNSNDVINYVMVYVICISLTILVSYLSYNFFEKRFLKLKDNFTTVKSISSK